MVAPSMMYIPERSSCPLIFYGCLSITELKGTNLLYFPSCSLVGEVFKRMMHGHLQPAHHCQIFSYTAVKSKGTRLASWFTKGWAPPMRCQMCLVTLKRLLSASRGWQGLIQNPAVRNGSLLSLTAGHLGHSSAFQLQTVLPTQGKICQILNVPGSRSTGS